MNPNTRGEILQVEGLDKSLVAYNPSPIGQDNSGRWVIAARVESSKSDWLNRIRKNGGPYDPRIQFFEVNGNKLLPLQEIQTLYGLEDPFATWLIFGDKKQLLLGGVRVDFDSAVQPTITTELFLGSGIEDLNSQKPFAVVKGMKDLRFCQSRNGDIIMLTRPTSGDAYPGSIGFTRISIDELTNNEILFEKIRTAKLLKFSFSSVGVKYGPNTIYSKINKDKLGNVKEVFHLICHTAMADAYFIDDKKIENDFTMANIHYAAYDCDIDPENLDEINHLRLLAQASDFDLTLEMIKGLRYEDVVFPGGIMDGYLYLGVGDRSIGRIKISNL